MTYKICPECGKAVKNLRKHIRRGRCYAGSGMSGTKMKNKKIKVGGK